MEPEPEQPRSDAPGILLITPWYGGNEGGVAVATEALAHGLIRSGIRCVVLELVPDGWLPRRRRGAAGELVLSITLRNPQAATSRLQRAGAKVRAFLARVAVWDVAKRYSLQIAHFHYALPEYGVLQDIVTAARLRAVVTFHGSDLTLNLDDPIVHAVTERLLRSCGAVTAVSAALGETLLEWFPFVRPTLRTVHNAIPEDFVALANCLDAPRDIDLLFVGNLIARKGVDILIRALPRVLGAYPQVVVTIAGDGIERRALEALARDLRVHDSIAFIGRQPRKALPSLYARARLLVVPSRAEPLGLVILEGQAAGATVIASAVGGIPEVIVDETTGVLVPPDDHDALASAIVTCLADDARAREIGARGRDAVQRAFSPDVMVARYVDVYHAALGCPA